MKTKMKEIPPMPGINKTGRRDSIIDKNVKPKTLILIPIVIISLGFLARAQAVAPAPDGGYPGGNTAEGQNALFSLTSGSFNTAVGFFSLRSNATGQFNTAIGAGTLLANTGDENTAAGVGALLSNTSGPANTANGAFALFNNATGGFNTATGDSALSSNTAGSQNTATGFSALQSNTSGSSNTANGAYALVNNTTGTENTANGMSALFSNTDGVSNTAYGSQALFSNTTASGNTANGSEALLNNNSNYNTADGFQALYSNTNGQFNTATGSLALSGNISGQGNVANGFEALNANTTGGLNTALGFEAGSGVITAGGVTCIGANVGGENVSNTTWIANVYGVFTESGTTAPVIVSDTGQLGILVSSERFKKDISTMEKTSEAILSLRPVTFHYKSDAKGTPQFGLIAEEVAKVNPTLVLRDKEGKPYSVRYDAVNAMLLNEFLKEHRVVQEQNSKIQQQEATITELKSMVAQHKKDFQTTVAQLTARLDEQASHIQKVSAQFEASRSEPQTALNNR